MASSYILLQAKQLLSETFLSTGFSFRDIGLDLLRKFKLIKTLSSTLLLVNLALFNFEIVYTLTSVILFIYILDYLQFLVERERERGRERERDIF